MPMETDVAVLGGGPGGYTAALRAARAGKRVILIERDRLGGTCLHRGCIPSKSLLRSAELYAAVRDASRYGIRLPAGEAGVDWAAVQARKEEVVERLHAGLRQLVAGGGVQVLRGKGRIIGPSIFSPRSGAVAVELEDGGQETVVPRHLILATGSRPRRLDGLPYDGERVATSDDALRWSSLPSSVLIVGGGVIGVEWASMLADFGARVTIVEAAERILPGEDRDVSVELARALGRRGVEVLVGARLLTETCRVKDLGVAVDVEAGGTIRRVEAERMLVSVGRQANVEDIGLENTDVRVERGFIAVRPDTLQTGEPHIYAVGDVIGGVQLAHAAMHEAAVAVDHLLGRETRRAADRDVPRCIYSRPEAAAIGWTEDDARAAGFDVRAARLPLRAVGKALVHGETDGFAKVVADRSTGDLLGVHLVGPHVTELIAEASLARFLDAVPWELARTIHPHPTLAEALQEAAMMLEDPRAAEGEP
jgi:dihydrolipoamide dehydrogenase